MANPLQSLFRWLNKTDANAVRNINAAASWPDEPRMVSVNSSILAGAQLIGERVAGLAKNDPVIASAISTIASQMVGPGVTLNTPDPTTDAQFNSLRLDPSRRLSMLALQCQIIATWATYGEAVALFVRLDDGLAVQLLHPEQLDRSKSEDLGGGRRIVAGVELDEFERRIAYWIKPRSDGLLSYSNVSRRFDAGDVLHIFDQEFPGQIRGVSVLAPILPLANTASTAVEAGLKKLQVSALMTAFIQSIDGDPLFKAEAKPSLEPGAMIRLNPGETISNVQGGEAGDLPAFLKLVHHQCAAAIGLTYEDLSGDLSQVNYSSYRAGALTARRKAEARRRILLIDGFLTPVFRRWQAIKLLAGERIFEGDPKWIEPVWPEIDRQKEANADVILLNAGLKSRKEIIEGRGREFEQVTAELVADDFRPTGVLVVQQNPDEVKE